MIEIRKNSGNGYSFVLKSESGHVLLKSVPFSNKKEADEVVGSLNSIVKKPNVFERKTNHNGQFLFKFTNNKGALIGNSQLYNSEAGMENGIKNLKARIANLSTLDQL